ncbi:unnamed protein product [Rhizoctonia solani]|uniref:Transmembrane protein n=1 Tax=Rhizoctonia solani TaxID=456999 RepID=A0A8H3H893_9AGAM|nr:unnamed protein product [Rhizoctonia solani]CAE6487323.1 unnamed protein product [Rhizoctonia solani]
MFAGRLASILLFVLSLGFLVCAVPSPMYGHSKAVSARGEGGRMAVLSGLEGSLRKQLDSCMRVKTADEAKVIINTVASQIKTTADSISQSGKLELDEHGKTDIAVRCASIISLLVKIICKLTQNIGSDAVLSLCEGVRSALQSLLVNIYSCVGDIYPLIVKKMASVSVEAILKKDFPECAKLLGLTA